ncbi:MAG: arginase family protein [Actinomycetota bacterium]|jgi:arginase family enzyme|nr:arginase family protein [Actinomycetota bacterium]
MTPDDPEWPRASAWLAARSDRAGLAVLGVGLSRTSLSPSAAHETPGAVRAALRRFSTYHTGSGLDLRDLPVVDHGDLAVDGMPAQAALDTIAAAVAALPAIPPLVLLGGDNALTRPALVARAPDLGRAGLLTLDAHHDVRDLHAGPTNGNPVRGLLDDGLGGGNVVQIGIGAFTNAPAHRRWADEQGVASVTVAEARREGVGDCVRRHLDALAQRCDTLYVDLDLDVLDAAFAPACPGARPGGLLPAELHDAAFAAGAHPAVATIDVVEVDAAADPTGITVDNAALCLLHVAAGVLTRMPALGSQVWKSEAQPAVSPSRSV